jgi:hypothetical protein
MPREQASHRHAGAGDERTAVLVEHDVWVMDADDGQIRQDTRSLADPRTKAIFAAKPARPVCVAVRA